MYLSYHGGECCGMYHIWCLPVCPDLNAPRIPSVSDSYDEEYYKKHRIKRYPESYLQYKFVSEEGNIKQTGEERLDAHLTYLQEGIKKSGIVEIVLQVTGRASQTAWRSVLEARGFKMVSSGRNSNTSNTIEVYHLVLGKHNKED